jgi:hypothetical protein
MEKGQNLSKMVFKDQYDALGEQEKKEFKKAFLEKSGISYPSFYVKLRNNTFKPLEEKCFNELMTQYSSFIPFEELTGQCYSQN